MTNPAYRLRLSVMGTALGVSLAIGLVAPAAQAFTPDPDMLSIKGYSPESIEVTALQRSRQEWKTPPPPKRTPSEQFWHNLYYNNWTGSFDEFGRSTIRRNF